MIWQTLTILGTNILLYILTQGLNNALTPVGLSIYLGGLFVAFPALYLPPTHALAVILLSAFIIDAPLLTSFGSTALIFSIGFYAASQARYHIHYPRKTLTPTVAFTLNIFLFLGTTLLAPETNFKNPNQLKSLAINLVLSQAVLVIAASWFFCLQQLLLSWVKTPAHSRT